MDAVFGPHNFRNEVIWKRTGAHSAARRYGPVHDSLLFYGKSDRITWNQLRAPYRQEYIDSKFTMVEAGTGRRFQAITLTPAGTRGGATGRPWRGIDPTPKGYHWKYTPDRLDQLDAAGRIYWPERGGMPRLKQYLDETKGVPLQDVWTDIHPINARAAERLHYPTQKPLPLLRRIIEASTEESQVVLDPFCGCGTTIEAAESLRRYWVGIDLDHEAIKIIRDRLPEGTQYELHGDPESQEGAAYLAAHDAYQLQWWAVRRLGGREVLEKKGADRGIDGRIILRTDQYAEAIVSVKAGKNPGPTAVRDLVGTIEHEKAMFGVLVTLHKPTQPMKAAAADAGGYSEGVRWYPRVQLLTAAEIIAGAQIEYPADVQITKPVATPPSLREPKMRQAAFRAEKET